MLPPCPQPPVHSGLEGSMGHTVPKRLSPVSGQEASVTARLTTSPRSGVAGGLRPHGPHIPSAWACDWPQLMMEDLRSAPCYDLKHHVEDPTGAEQSQQLCCRWTLPCGADGEILPPAKPWGSCPNCHWSRHEWGPGNISPPSPCHILGQTPRAGREGRVCPLGKLQRC